MAKTLSDDILISEGAATRPQKSPLAAFVPIAIALAGVAAVLFGGISARHVQTAEQTIVIDPITTGSIASEPKAQSVSGHEQRWE
jgi:hypothetical protein